MFNVKYCNKDMNNGTQYLLHFHTIKTILNDKFQSADNGNGRKVRSYMAIK